MLLERESELGTLDDLLAGLDTSGGKVVLVRGEAGIGKSALVRQFIKTHSDEAHIYFGSCYDLLTPQPLGPLRDIAHDEPGLAVALASDDRSAVLATSLDLLSGSLRPNIMVFEAMGATAVAAKLRKALRDQGVTVPRAKSRDTRRHAAGLTARQAEVLQLLDEGLSNIEIADRLFVSPRTVESHVSAVLTKLDSSTREEAVSRARDEGSLPVHG